MPAIAELPRATSRARGRPKVLLTCEGTYPHYTGGVSTWCDRLMRGVDDVDFVVWALMMNPFIKQQFEFPDNVVGFVEVPLWGVEQPAEYTREIPSAKVFSSSRNTRHADVDRHFIPLFTRFLDQMSSAFFSPADFATVLAEMHEYFRNFEYRATWRSRVVWETFKERMIAPTGRELPERRSYDPDEEYEPMPNWRSVLGSFRYLLSERNGDLEPPANGDQDDVPVVGEAIEGLRWLYRLLQTLNVEVPEADVTHSAAAAFCAIPCILAKVERGTPFLLTEHGVYLREQYLNIERRRYPYNLKRFLIDLVSAVAQTGYHLADQVSPVCKFNARWEVAYGTPQDRLQVIYNGVDEDIYRPISSPRPDAPVVVQVGRIDPLKDQLTFLRVADLVRREIPNVEFHHYGPVADDDYAEEVKELQQELDLGRTVTFFGETDDVAGAYGTADVSLMTSISEAFPFGVVEALMCGKPVVSTSVGGVPEALNGTGATAPARDEHGLARAVIDFLRLSPEQRADVSERARRRGLEHFTLARFVNSYRTSYFDLAGRERVPASETLRAVVVEEPATATEADIDEAADLEPARPPLALPPADAPGEVAPPEPVEPEPGPEPVIPSPATATDPISLPELTTALASEDPFVRVRAVSRVGPEAGASAVLIEALTDPYPHVRREVVRALARVGGPDAVRALAGVASTDPAPEVRMEAVAALEPLLGDDVADEEAGA